MPPLDQSPLDQPSLDRPRPTGLTLVMGARRGIGRLVLDQLRTAGARVRASSRDVQGWQAPDEVEAVRADLTDPASLASAFEGVQQVVLFAVRGEARRVAEAARAAGVRRVVLLSSGSVLVPTSRTNPITVEHRETEEAFAAVLGAALVPVRPLVLATNALGWAHELRTSGHVSLYQPDALNAPVHEADVAAVAVAALASPTGTALPAPVSDLLTGPRPLSQRAQVELVGEALGRPVPVIKEGREQAHGRMTELMGAERAEPVLQFLDDCAAGHSPATGTAAAVLGREPLPYERWVSDHVGDFR